MDLNLKDGKEMEDLVPVEEVDGDFS